MIRILSGSSTDISANWIGQGEGLSTMRLQSGHQVHYVVWAACPSQGVDGA